jgi:site-specific DNA recombinase
MIAAIYARKSTDQNIADEEKSVTRKVERARQYAERKGWTVDPAAIFIDDGVSGADFVRREGFLRLMNALKPRPPFQVLVMMEQSRLGRSLDEVPYAIRQIAGAGVRIYCYLTDTEAKSETLVDRFQPSVMAFVDDMHREQSRQRTRDALRRHAERGYVAGGLVYGYRNVEVRVGDKRSHVLREIDEDQAAVIRRILRDIARGDGFCRIAKRLNGGGVPSPRPKRHGWAVSGVREIVLRDLYRGQVVYGKTRWKDRDRTRDDQARAKSAKYKVTCPSSEWITTEEPRLRIVDEPL